MYTLEEWKASCKILTCQWCGASLRQSEVDHYPHPDGLRVAGMGDRQWLSLHCHGCGYDWSLWKLGAPRDRMCDWCSVDVAVTQWWFIDPAMRHPIEHKWICVECCLENKTKFESLRFLPAPIGLV